MTLVRKQILITNKQEEFLKKEKEKREGVSEADIIREALNMYMESKKKRGSK